MLSVLRLALPVALSYLGLMMMGFVDTLILGHLGPAELGGAGVGNSLTSWLMVAGIGLITGMEYPAATAVGAGRPREAFRAFVQANLLAWMIGVPSVLILLLAARFVPAFGFDPKVTPFAASFVAMVAISMIPAYGFNACRSYLQVNHIALPTTYVLLVANLLNAGLSVALIWGKWGFPALGFIGSPLATVIVRYFMYAATLIMIWHYDRRRDEPFLRTESLFRLNREILARIVRLGTPGAVQMALEVGVFALATALAARFSAEELAAHHIVLSVASLTFMVPLGISSAAATLVGHAIGANAYALAAKNGWRSFQLGWIFNFSAAVILLLFAEQALTGFTHDERVIALAKSLLVIAGLFQLSDGMQVIATGALRGLGNTRTPALANLVGHWLIGFPISVWLAFYTSMRVVGLWIGLATGLTAVSLALVIAWRRETRDFSRRSLAELPLA